MSKIKTTKSEYVQDFIDLADNDDLQEFLNQDLETSVCIEEDIIKESGIIITDLTTVAEIVKVMKIKAMLVLEEYNQEE